MNQRNGLEGGTRFRKLKNDQATGTIAKRRKSLGIDARRGEQDLQRCATDRRIRPLSASKGIVLANIASGLPKKVCPP